jgi:hypothetical protein
MYELRYPDTVLHTDSTFFALNMRNNFLSVVSGTALVYTFLRTFEQC